MRDTVIIWLFCYISKFLKYLSFFFHNQVWILTTDIGQFPAKKSSYIRWKLLHIWHLSGMKLRKIISYRRLKTQKHSLRIDLSCSSFSFYEHFNKKLTFVVFLIFKTGSCVWVKRFYNNTLLFFALLETAYLLKIFLYHYIALKT